MVRPCHRRRRRECAGGDDGDCVPAAPDGAAGRWRGCRRRTACATATGADCAAARVPGCVWRAWNRRATRPGCYPDGRPHHGPAVGGAPSPPLPRRVVSYSLFWSPARGAGYRGRRHPLAEFAHGLWRSVEAARAVGGWRVRVYHDGTAERALRRLRAAHPPHLLECVRVAVPPDLRGRRYLGCLFRLLAADDRRDVDVFLSRDLDDPLDPEGLRLVERRWLAAGPVPMHTQAEPYDTPTRRGMANLGWFGQRNDLVAAAVAGGAPPPPAMGAAVLRFARTPGNDRYTADEEFLTDVWIPAMREWWRRAAPRRPGRHPPAVVGLPSHPYRRSGRRSQRTSVAWRRFRAGPLPPPELAAGDAVVPLG